MLAGVAPTVYHTGGLAPAAAATGTDTTPVVTETYVAEVFIPVGATLTGVAPLIGSANAGNVAVALADASGTILAQSASTATTGAAAYQQVPFAAPVTVKSGKYFVLLQSNNTSNRYRSHAVGNFAAGKLTGQTFGTFANFTPPTTFTANLGPIADTY